MFQLELTFVKVLDSKEISEVMSRMFVMHTKMNMSGGPRIGEIYRGPCQ